MLSILGSILTVWKYDEVRITSDKYMMLMMKRSERCIVIGWKRQVVDLTGERKGLHSEQKN